MKTRWIHLPIFLLLSLIGCQQSQPETDVNIAALRQKAYDSQQKALQYMSQRQTDSAFAHFHNAKELYIKTGDSVQAVYNLLNIADIYKQYNDYAEVEETSTDAIRYLNNTADTVYNPIIYINLGISYRNLHNYSAALDSYRESLEITNNPLVIAINNNNIANVLIDSTAYAPAQTILKRVIEMPALAKDSTMYARVYDNLGFVNHKLGSPDAMEQMLRAEEIRRQQKDTFGQITSLMHLAESYAGTDTALSIRYAENAGVLAAKLNSTDDHLEALAFIIKNSPQPNQIAQAARKRVTLMDSILDVRQRAKNGFAAIKYESKSAKDRVAKLEAERAVQRLQQQRTLLVSIVILLSLILGIGLLVLWLKHKHKKEKLREGYLVETRISKKVHDELANDVYGAIAFAETADLTERSQKEKLLHNLDDIYARTRDISHQNSPITTGRHYEEQLRQMLIGYHNNDNRIIIQGISDITWENISDEKKMATYRAMHELMVNMKKHSRATHVGIRFEYEGKNLNIMYSDNGVGMPANGNIFKNGLSNVENRIHAIGGTITFEPGLEKGLKIIISYKAKR